MQIDGMSILIKQQKNAAENLAADPISSLGVTDVYGSFRRTVFSSVQDCCAISYAILLSVAIQAR